MGQIYYLMKLYNNNDDEGKSRIVTVLKDSN